MTLNSQTLIGNSAEALAFDICMSLGFRVSWPTTKTSRFDLFVNGYRVQVKCRTVARRLIQPHRVYLNKNNRCPYGVNEIDAVALLFIGQWYVIPTGAFRIRNGLIQNSFDIRKYERFKDKWSFFECGLHLIDLQTAFPF